MRIYAELVIYLLNLVALGYLISICINGNDKAVFALIFGQPILIVLNLYRIGIDIKKQVLLTI